MRKTIYILSVLTVSFCISCKKESTPPSSSNSNNNNNNNTVTVNSTPQFTGTINGVSYSLVTGSVYSGGTSSSKSTGSSSNTGTYESYMNNTNTGQPFLGITKGTLQLGSSNFADTASFDAFFTTGTYPYSMNALNGITIQWLDANGNVYSTSQGSGSQTGSSFTIVAKRALGFTSGLDISSYEVAVMAKFNCTLYSTSGTSITLTNGVYVGPFEND